MSGDQPLLLLDVDGVLNAVTAKPDTSVWRDWRHGIARTVTDGRAWPICFSATVVAQVRAWHDELLAEIRWLTTWQSNATGELQELLGLPTFAVAGSTEFERAVNPVSGPSNREVWWKFDAVIRMFEQDPHRPIVWIDDDLAGFPDVQVWLRDRDATCLLVAPKPYLGLTPKLLRQVSAFLEDHRSRGHSDSG